MTKADVYSFLAGGETGAILSSLFGLVFYDDAVWTMYLLIVAAILSGLRFFTEGND